MTYSITEFSNGITLVHQQTESPLSHMGFIINAGSRNEDPDKPGLSHFVEHCLFKGTRRRKAYHVIARMENVGADINAYTSREETVIHVSFLPAYTRRTLDLLFDICFHSGFPEAEVERERQVIRDEIRAGQEQAFDMIHEDFESLLFPDHALGKPILGTLKSVKSVSRNQLYGYFRRHYIPENLIICSSGGITPNRIKAMVESMMKEACPDDSGTNPARETIVSPPAYLRFETQKKTAFEQGHCVIGGRAWSLHHPGRYALSLLNNLLAGPAMSSMVNYRLREKLGFAYHVEGNFSAFEDCGQWLLYFATDPESMNLAREEVFAILKKMCTQKLGNVQLARAKRQFAGQVMLLQDSNLQNILNAGKSLLSYHTVEGIDDVMKQIDSISAQSILEAANEVMAPELLSVLEYWPRKR